MAVDYYKLLQVQRNARGDDLRIAAEAKLNLINDAYEVLSDPIKRAVYDQHGEEGLKREAATPPDSPGSTRLNFTDFFGAGTGGSRVKETRQPEEILSTFFEGRPTREDVFQRSMFREDIFAQFRGGAEPSAAAPRKAAPIERTLPCTLEDLYKGTTKKMKISRDVPDASGRTTTVEEILTIEIKPGWKKGTKITFPEKGNEQRGIIPADLVFIIDEKPHTLFKRDGNDLTITQKISLAEALTGYMAQLTTLDGRNLTVSITNIISPTYEEVVKGEGMPIPKEPSKKGNLRIKFNIKFPTKLTSDQKTNMKRLLTS